MRVYNTKPVDKQLITQGEDGKWYPIDVTTPVPTTKPGVDAYNPSCCQATPAINYSIVIDDPGACNIPDTAVMESFLQKLNASGVVKTTAYQTKLLRDDLTKYVTSENKYNFTVPTDPRAIPPKWATMPDPTPPAYKAPTLPTITNSTTYPIRFLRRMLAWVNWAQHHLTSSPYWVPALTTDVLDNIEFHPIVRKDMVHSYMVVDTYKRWHVICVNPQSNGAKPHPAEVSQLMGRVLCAIYAHNAVTSGSDPFAPYRHTTVAMFNEKASHLIAKWMKK